MDAYSRGVLNRVAFYADLELTKGAGHVMRCVALAEELTRRGVVCTFVADFHSVPWAADQVASRGFDVCPYAGDPLAAGDAILGASPSAVVLDTYTAPPALSEYIRRTGISLMAIVDGDTRGQSADLYLDQNIGAEEIDYSADLRLLTGLEHALVRDEVVRHRPAAPPKASSSRTPNVLAYFGGTDAFGAGPVVVDALVRSGHPFRATVVAPRAELRDAICRLRRRPGQELRVIGPPASLMRLAARADLVISAAGTSLVEQFCLGSATAVVCVADNQRRGYDLACERQFAVGLGQLADLRDDLAGAADRLHLVLSEPGTRDTISRNGWTAVDGRGRERVVDALAELTNTREAR